MILGVVKLTIYFEIKRKRQLLKTIFDVIILSEKQKKTENSPFII